jgi:hypothetical protein
MPNWCDNVVTIAGDKVKIAEILKTISDREASRKFDVPGFLGYCVPEPDYSTTPVARAFPEIAARHANSEEEMETALKNEPTIRKDSWYNWRLQNWGTKWEVDDISISQASDTCISLSFMSAWSPPIDALDKLLEQDGIDSIVAHYYEPGNNFTGVYNNGENIEMNLSALTEEDFENNDLIIELNEIFGIRDDASSEEGV